MTHAEAKRLDVRPGAHWPHSWVDSKNPETLALAGLWKSWLDFHRTGQTKQASEVLDAISRQPADPAHLFTLWLEAYRAKELELAAKIDELIQYR